MRDIKFHVNHNECGDCRVCCTVFPFTGKDLECPDEYNEVPHFEEKYDLIYTTGKSCNQLCSTGCSIQHDKPKLCQEFWCDYLKYELPEKYFPHNCGFASYIYDKNDHPPELWIIFDELQMKLVTILIKDVNLYKKMVHFINFVHFKKCKLRKVVNNEVY